jgi:hypothetical protein
MDTAQPLQISKGSDRILVMLNGRQINNLSQFQVLIKPPAPVLVHYVLVGFPTFTFADAPDDALSNNAFPLRFNIGDNPEENITTFKSRPFGGMTEIMIEAEAAAAKPIIRLTFDKRIAPPQELLDALVKLGVEVVVDHADL